MIEGWAERDPSRVAVVCGERRISYGELNVRANQLARHLRALGVGPETLVGLCVDRSLEIAVGVLAILKAGGGWLPLDPVYPAERLVYMLEHARPAVLLAPSSRLANLPATGARTVALDAASSEIGRQSGNNLEEDSPAEAVAYVIYTSGSTGQPKGVVITNGNLSCYVAAMSEALGLESRAHYLHTASISFSSSVRQLMLPLSRGATVVMATVEQVRDPLELFAEVKRQGVTVIDLVPSYWRSSTRALASLPENRRRALLANYLEMILSASEPLLSDLPEIWAFDFEHPARLVNMFGQTETTGIVATYEIPRVRQERARVVPIGRPIPGTRILLLDEGSKPVPAGVPGEIHVGGPGVGRGYLHDTVRTAEKFVPDPSGRGSGDRMYRTGDLAVSLPDGTLEFLGRRDRQVKVRGHRVELGEVEAVVSLHPGVNEAVVTAREADAGEKRLVAYVVAREKPGQVVNELRTLLREKLPEYMVPGVFVTIDALPRLPNGKVDRSSLPAPELSRLSLKKAYAPPVTATERRMAEIWSDVLGIARIGIHDNFFDLGGHSLLAVRLTSEIERVFGRQVTPPAILQAPTIEQLAVLLQEKQWSGPWPSLAAIQAAGSRPPLFCVHPLAGSAVWYRELGRYLAPDQPLYGLQPLGLDGKEPPHSRIEDMAAYYIQEIRKPQPEGPYYLGGFSLGGWVAFEMACQLEAMGERVALVALFDTDNLPREAPPETPRASGYLRANLRRLRARIRFHLGVLVRLDWKARLLYIGEKSRTALGWPARVVSRAYHAIRYPVSPAFTRINEAHLQAARDRILRTYGGRVTLFRASERQLEPGGDPYLRWGEVSRGGVEVHEVPGGHLTILTEPNVRVLAEKLKVCLVQAQAEPPNRAAATAPFSAVKKVASSSSH